MTWCVIIGQLVLTKQAKKKSVKETQTLFRFPQLFLSLSLFFAETCDADCF
ncbi:hypothetical protein AtEden1_Chr1g0034111 [Arabidopsis thaliana]